MINRLAKKLSRKQSATTAQPLQPLTLTRGVVDSVSGSIVQVFIAGSLVSVPATSLVTVTAGQTVEIVDASPRMLILGVLV